MHGQQNMKTSTYCFHKKPDGDDDDDDDDACIESKHVAA